MDIKTKETFSEVYSMLNMLGENYITKLPPKLYKMIKEEKSNEYNPQYDITISLDQQKIKKETLSMIAVFHLNYWCNSPEEKQKLEDLFNENEIRFQNKLREKYNPDNIFKSKKLNIDKYDNVEIKQNNTTALIEYEKSFFKRVKKFLYKILHINN